MPEYYGFTDAPAKEDAFSIEQYIKGLASFIESCNTPMTISIQGSWGTGKTSVMKFVQRELDKKTLSIDFNTWQFSQFNQQDVLAGSLLTTMMEKMRASRDTVIAIRKSKKAMFSKGLDWTGKTLAVVTGNEMIAQMAGDLANKINETDQSMDDMDTAHALAKLKDYFTDAVNETLKAISSEGKDRIVFYIDDLDRLEPRKAVELLEVMKLFFDVEGCVFILAIDYDVVVRGVAAKYGTFSEDKNENAAKGKSFFDKIIQVPFKMPVGEYDINAYVDKCLGAINISSNKDDLEKYVNLIKTSIGTNPRSMKRLFNAYLLLNKVKEKAYKHNSRGQMTLFALLCMQFAYEGIYNYILKNRFELSDQDLFQLSSEDHEDLLVNQIGKTTLAGVDIERLHSFMENFIDIIDDNHNQKLDDEELDALRQLLDISSITNSTDTTEAPKEENSKYKIKKTAYRFIGKEYFSGSRKGNNIGFLVHDVIKYVAQSNAWSKDDAILFREEYYKLGKTGWLCEVILLENEVLALPSIPDCNYTQEKDEHGNRKTGSVEAFTDWYICSKTLEKRSETETTKYGIDDVQSDEFAITLSDGVHAYTARYFGDANIDKVLKILEEQFNTKVDIERTSL